MAIGKTQKTPEELMKQPFRVGLNRKMAGFFKCPLTEITLTKEKPVSDIINPEETNLRYLIANVNTGALDIYDLKGEKVIFSKVGISSFTFQKSDKNLIPVTDEIRSKLRNISNASMSVVENYVVKRTQRDLLLLKELRKVEMEKPKSRKMAIAMIDDRIKELEEFDKEQSEK